MDKDKLGMKKRNGYGVTDSWDQESDPSETKGVEWTKFGRVDPGVEDYLRNDPELKKKLGRKDLGDREVVNLKAKVDPMKPGDLGKAQGQSMARAMAEEADKGGIKDDAGFLLDVSDPVGLVMGELGRSEGMGNAGPVVASKNPLVNARNASKIWMQVMKDKPKNKAEMAAAYFKARYPTLSKAAGKYTTEFDYEGDEFGNVIESTRGLYNPVTDDAHIFNREGLDRLKNYVDVTGHENQHAFQVKNQGRGEEFYKGKYYPSDAGAKFAEDIKAEPGMKKALEQHGHKMYLEQPVEKEARKAGGTASNTYTKFENALPENQYKLWDANRMGRSHGDSIESTSRDPDRFGRPNKPKNEQDMDQVIEKELEDFYTNSPFYNNLPDPYKELDDLDEIEKTRPKPYENSLDPDDFAVAEHRSFNTPKGDIELSPGDYHDDLAKKLGYKGTEDAVKKGLIRVSDGGLVETNGKISPSDPRMIESVRRAAKDLAKERGRFFYLKTPSGEFTYNLSDVFEANFDLTELEPLF